MRFHACRGLIASTALAVLTVLATPAASASRAASFDLANGMKVVVISDHRVPVVTHMVWYRVGAADDPAGKTGLAHFLEHLMFKGTGELKSGDFTRLVSRMGARHNAITTHDTTHYFQRVAKQHLKAVMALEADRMVSLRFLADEVSTERDVVREERRSSIDANPISLLNEQMMAQLYLNHPYGRPVLGWPQEITALTLEDARAFYQRNYAPNNAILVVAGDVTPDEVRPLAEATYGRVRANASILPRSRIVEPEPIGQRSVRIEDKRAGAPLVLRYFHVPSFKSGARDAAALAIAAHMLGGDDTSRLYRRLVIELKVAAQAGADYQGNGLDSGRLALLALAGKELPVQRLEAALDEVMAELREQGPSPAELERARFALETAAVLEQDAQEKLAKRYGEALAVGRTLADLERQADMVAAVTLEDVRLAVARYLAPQRSVTGALVRAPAVPK